MRTEVSEKSWLSQVICLGIWGFVHFIIILVFCYYDLLSSLPLVREDVLRYEGFARCIFAGLLPYRDFAAEYPPLSLLIFVIPKLITQSEAGYRAVFFFLMMLFEAVVFLFLIKSRNLLAASGYAFSLLTLTVVYLVYLLSLGHIAYFRYDIVVALVILLALYFSISNRPILSWMFLAFAVAFKGFAIFLVPIFLIYELCRTNIKWKVLVPIISFLMVSLALWVPFFAISPKGFFESFIYHISRGIEIGSTYSSIVLLMRYLGLQVKTAFGHQSIEVISMYSPILSALSSLLLIGTMIFIYIRSYYVFVSDNYRQDHGITLIRYTALTMLAFILTFKVFSPQYLAWFIPLIPLLGLDKAGIARFIQVGFIFAAGLTQFIVFRFFELVKFTDILLVVQLVRNLVLWFLFVSMFIQYARRNRPRSVFLKV